MSEELGVPTIEALEFHSANEVMNHILLKERPLPVWLHIGRSAYKITEANKEAFARGCLFASDSQWRRE